VKLGAYTAILRDKPPHPDPEVRDKHGRDVRDAIELAALLGVKRVVTMPGLAALDTVDPDMAVNIEHEDQELDQLEGLQYAAATLLEASGRTGSREVDDRGGR
jgi:sugar phosphate isomerase/epimerase